MNRIFHFSTSAALAALLALGSLSLTSCSEDNLDTNPYSKSGVNIVAMGPMPVSRGDAIRITGTRLNQVKAIVFPGSKDIASEEESTIEVTDFVLNNNEEITVVVPDYALAGHVSLLTKSGEMIESLSLITYVEPIKVTSVSPLSDLSAGDIITVKGDYIWNIATATFTDGVVVGAADFLKVNRVEAQIAVPVEAVSGQLVLSDGDESNPQEFIYQLTVNSAAASSLDKSAANGEEYEFGDVMTVSGHHLNLVASATFPSGIDVPFEANADGTQLTMKVPAECCSGEVLLTQHSGLKINTPAYAVPTVSVSAVNGSAEGIKDIMAGDLITIKGKNLDRIREFYLPGADAPTSEYTLVDPETITFNAPEGMLDGAIRIVQNNSIAIETPALSMKKMGNVVWQGNVPCIGWGGSFGIYTWSGSDWTYWTEEVFNAPGILTLHFDNPNGSVVKLTRSGDWSTPFDNIQDHEYAKDGDPSCLDVPAGVTEVSFALTDADVAAIRDSGFTFYGDGYTLTMIEYKKGNEESIWSGSQVFGGWEGWQGLAWGGFDWSTIKPDSVLRFYITINNPGEWAFIGLRHGDGWNSLPNASAYDQIDLTDETVVAFDMPANVIDDLVAFGGMVVVGANITITGITVE